MADLNPEDDQHRLYEVPANEWRVRVAELNNLATKSLTVQVGAHGLAPMEFDILRICHALDRECTATELVRHLPVDPARISRLVNTLVDGGLLIRRRTREDRRIVMLRLSDRGRELISSMMEDLTRYNASLIDGIGADELQVFLHVTSQIIANLDAMEEPQQAE